MAKKLTHSKGNSHATPSKLKERTRCSPIFFAEELPRTQVHLAKGDKIVPVSEGEKLKIQVIESGHADRFELFIYEGRDHSNIAKDNTELNDRIEELLSEL